MPVIQAADIPILSVLYKAGKLAPAPAGTKLPPTLSGPRTIPPPCKSLNDRVGLIRGDITALGVDAVVNAANRSLLGGGGVDGAIHRAAGRELKDECRSLGGCATGSAKITGAYNLPCKKVIHAVGPVFDAMRPDISETHLSGCYRTSLALAVENDCRTVAFSAISTGVYGYPSNEAAPVALGTIRRFLEQEDAEGKIEKVVLVTFENKDVQAYNKSIPLYFPPVADAAEPTEAEAKSEEAESDEAEQEAEARAVASALPSAPTSDPADNGGHVDKKQKHDDT
ncbi:hypothetical protein P8C59_005523 [Phyllachora maydis]|uniref:Macro domain-containing protein n=1 Tax=Phyllachora maydis TaxID=1825666 RepID=A0AAD9MDK6_9PEZI|nr:hypothetical protein P8C59_005523 [Phyllachora maydis]